MTKIKVLIADDHPATREGLRRRLEDEEDFEVVGCASDGAEAVQLVGELRPDVAIVDVAMPRVDGIEAARQIKECSKATAVLMISAYDYESYILASLKAGAAGYVLKNTLLREMVSAVRLVHSGEAVFNLGARGNILRRLTSKDVDTSEFGRLGNREVEVLKLAAQGYSNKEIGDRLVISDRTVQTHLVHIFRKLCVGSRTEAVLRALKLGWLTPDDLP